MFGQVRSDRTMKKNDPQKSSPGIKTELYFVPSDKWDMEQRLNVLVSLIAKSLRNQEEAKTLKKAEPRPKKSPGRDS